MTTFVPGGNHNTINLLQQKQVFITVSAIILCAQIYVMQVTQEDLADLNAGSKEKAQWNDAEIIALLNYLITNRSKMAATSFKIDTFNKAATAIEAQNIRTQGIMKTGAHWCAAEDAWSAYLTNPANAGMKQFKNGWRFYAKMEQLLSRVSTAHGAAAYNPSADAAATATTATTADMGLVAGPSTSNTPGGVDIAHEPITPSPVVMGPPLTSASSSESAPIQDMLFDHSALLSTTSTSVSHVSSAMSDKKLKLSTQGSGRSHASSSKRAAKEAASTAAVMNLQGTISCLADTLNLVFGSTDESQLADDRSHVLQAIQEEETLTGEDKLILVHAFMRSPVICSTYIQIMELDLRTTFLRSIIEQTKKTLNL
ncbi:uncharacterized protein F5147DRAFT_651173 [Suillus discolor]|uniref:Myb/SANT-like domain-containing protein n=1 Tax=Suillus discolor TaxID=1912936 RepID=A0A9P7F9U2_9AGAM|nr:uncharacterized protein F5147DRAFT_651173 [Suillus discolor]KAG2111491.1 hypothetical protein F5147DRAFT_651173 [Suillus discolor]